MDVAAHGLTFWLVTTEIAAASSWSATWIQTSISLFWTLYGATLVTRGFFVRKPVLRYSGLVLLGMTIVKLLCVDLAMVSMEARVLSFLVLGVLLVTIATFYQRSSRRRIAESS